MGKTKALVKAGTNALSTTLKDDLRTASEYHAKQRADSTLRAYKTDWRIFSEYCNAHGAEPLPASPALIAAFVSHEAKQGKKPSTLQRRLAAIRVAHTQAGLESPTKAEIVTGTMSGIRHEMGTRATGKAAATADVIKKMVSCVGKKNSTDIWARRDKALLLIGFGGALRRSEIAALNVEDVEFVSEGARLFISKSKTDQDGLGASVPVIKGEELCPVRALRDWIDAAEITDGPLFRGIRSNGSVMSTALSTQAIANSVKRLAGRAGLDSADYSGHSLRSGFCTSAAQAGASAFAMMAVTRHRSVETLQRYVRQANAFKNHAGAGLL